MQSLKWTSVVVQELHLACWLLPSVGLVGFHCLTKRLEVVAPQYLRRLEVLKQLIEWVRWRLQAIVEHQQHLMRLQPGLKHSRQCPMLVG